MRRPPPLPLSLIPPLPGPKSTRLYNQGVQAAVQAPNTAHAEESDAGGALSDVSTQSLSSYIDHNLSEVHGAEPSALTIADPEMINLAEELTTGPFSRVRMKAFGRWMIAPLVCSAISVAACWFLWGRQPRPGATMPTVAVVAPAAAAVAPPPSPAPASPPAAAPAVAPAPLPAVAPAPVARPAIAASASASDRHCRARITSHPSGATVMLGDHRLGDTPFETGELPCVGTSFTVVRPRYSSAVVALPDAPGKPSALFVKLNRPAAQLTLTSTPPNAQLRVNHNVIGGAPQSLAVQRYEKVHIEASLPGHRKWQKTVYVTAATTPINVTLAPGR